MRNVHAGCCHQVAWCPRCCTWPPLSHPPRPPTVPAPAVAPFAAAEPRSQESYYGSVSVSQLVGAAYQAADREWLPPRRKLREGSVVHIYLPDASLSVQGGLWVSCAAAGRQGGWCTAHALAEVPAQRAVGKWACACRGACTASCGRVRLLHPLPC